MLKTNKENLLADLDMSKKHAYLRLEVRESNLIHDALHAHILEARIAKVLAIEPVKYPEEGEPLEMCSSERHGSNEKLKEIQAILGEQQ